MNVTHVSVMLALFGALSLVQGIAVAFIPETKDKEMPDTIAEARRQWSKAKSKVDSDKHNSYELSTRTVHSTRV